MRTITKSAVFLLIVAGAILAALLLAECYARITSLPPAFINLSVGGQNSAYKLSENRILGYEMKPGYRDPDDPNLNDSFPRVNSIGFRDAERSVEKSSFRILMLGDSVLAGHGIRNIDDLISRKLESRLKSRGYDLEVLNFGVGGYATYAEIELLRLKGILFDPDLVIILFIQNDFELFGYQLHHYKPEKEKGVLKYLLTNLRLFRYLAFRYDLFGVAYKYDPEYRVAVSREMGLRTGMREHMGNFLTLSNEHGFKPLVAYWPKFPEEKGADAFELSPWRENFDQLSPITDSLGIELVDMAPFFEEDYRRKGMPDSPSGFYTRGDGMHPVEPGMDAGAAILEQILEDGGYLPAKRGKK